MLFQDERFNHDIDQQTGYKTRSLLCMPIKDINGEVIGVAQVHIILFSYTNIKYAFYYSKEIYVV